MKERKKYFCDCEDNLILPSGRIVHVTLTGIDADQYSSDVLEEFDSLDVVVLYDGTEIA